jgi:hypothetical protein
MERESFEDEEVARLLNENFVAVKVDREERPDVDAIYMTAVQLLTRQGGWPMSVFLTPELKPFYGGTYFPPEDRYGRLGFKQLLRNLAAVWKNDRQKVLELAGNLTRDLRAEDLPAGARPAASEAPPDAEIFDAAFEHAERSFDSIHGGFGGAPKFPRSVDLSQLLLYHHATGERNALAMVELTLRRMAEGGIQDQIGGGFHRYSTDAQWLVPHFEKMLYDNALLARAYLEGYQATADEFYLGVATRTLDYLLREMTSPEGGFYSATDADSEGEEGRFFVWTYEEVESILGPEKARPFAFYYGITAGGNFEGRNILHVVKTVQQTERAFKLEPAAVEALLEEGRERLYREREKREKPFRDEKVITSWNALAISAMARGYRVTLDRRYLEAAEKAERLLREEASRGELLYRIYKDGQAKVPAYLDDYAYLVEAGLDLYEATFDPTHLARARALADRLVADFWDEKDSGFFYSAPHHRDLIARRKDPFDNATPAGSGVAALDLLRLERLTGVSNYRQLAEALFASLKNAMLRVPVAFGSTLIALDSYHRPAIEIAVLGDPAAPETTAALRAIGRRFIPRRVLAGSRTPVDPKLAAEIPLLAGKEARGGMTTIYLCRDFACQAPLNDPAALEAELEKLSEPAPGSA